MLPAIRVENLGKSYRIGRNRQSRGYRTLRETLVEAAAAPLRRLRDGSRQAPGDDTFWALKDVDFEVQPGEVVGIIGRNGAGKSTLLKILSRITKPTTGRVEIHGRVGSLLEVGTGFHPELTGRENIYLNGSILGMRRAEIRRRFDEIVAFAEVEKFLDTPVKRYSSGMYVRLAFAVAAHLEPEILIVDEVLAVGDAEFQRKCLGKINQMSHSGRTSIFVSHQMDSIQRLCSAAIFLSGGKIVSSGHTKSVVANYMEARPEAILAQGPIDVSQVERNGRGGARFVSIHLHSPQQDVAYQPCTRSPLYADIEIESDCPQKLNSLAVTFYDDRGTKLVNADSISRGQPIELHSGKNAVRLMIDSLRLNPGVYVIGLWMADELGALDHAQEACRSEVFEVVDVEFGNKPKSDGLVPCHTKIVERV